MAHISTKALTYINKLVDTAQYPASHCTMGEHICMYGRSASSGNESMNQANKRARKRAVIDLVNATMVLLNLENDCFTKKREIAWNSDDVLTSKGKELREMAFKDIDVTNYIINVFIPEDDFTMCKVKATGPRGNWNTLRFPNEEIAGSRFRTCTCGIPKVKGIPCHHMVAVLKSGLLADWMKITSCPLGG